MIQQIIFTQKHRLRSPEVDLYGRWRASDIFLVMQELAGGHSLQLGCHMKDLMPRGITWVLSRVHMQMNMYPQLGEEVILKTWTGGVQRVIFPRFFVFERPDGTVLGSAHTLWLLLDLDKRRMVGADALGVDYPSDKNIPAPAAAPVKLTAPAQLEHMMYRRARYSDLDINRHMNNTRYIEWICDLFASDAYVDQALSSLTINYTHEIAPDMDVGLYLHRQSPEFYVVGKDEQITFFTAKGQWQKGL